MRETETAGPSTRAAQLLAELIRAPTLKDRVLGRAHQHVMCLRELATVAEPATVPWIVQFVFSAEPAVARAASIASDAIFRAADPQLVPRMELGVRRLEWGIEDAPKGWISLKPVDVARFGSFAEGEEAVVALATFHHNGYVREAAIERLDDIGGALALPFLLQRTNDWVPQVATRAREAVSRRLLTETADEILHSLSLVLKLVAARRRDNSGLLHLVYQRMREEEQGPALMRWLVAENLSARRIAFRIAREANGVNLADVSRAAFRDKDTVIRLEAVEDLRHRPASDELTATLSALSADPYPLVRSKALSVADETLGDSARPWLVAALADRSPGVRQSARFLMKRRDASFDVGGHYRRELRDAKSTRAMVGALSGLGETGDAADLGVILPFLAHDRPTVRRAALRSVGMLHAESELPRIVAFLNDPASSVSGTARRILRPLATRVGRNELVRVARESEHVHGRANAAALATALGKWESLAMLLEIASMGDLRIREFALRSIDEWIRQQNRSQVRPTRDQLRDIRRELDGNALGLSNLANVELTAVVEYWTTEV